MFAVAREIFSFCIERVNRGLVSQLCGMSDRRDPQLDTCKTRHFYLFTFTVLVCLSSREIEKKQERKREVGRNLESLDPVQIDDFRQNFDSL
jgi:hypothetical protein